MHANSESKAFIVASHVSCSLKQSEIVSCCCQAVGKRVEPEMGDNVHDITDDAEAWMWKRVSPAIYSCVSSQKGPSCLRKVKYWGYCNDFLFLNKMITVFVLKSNRLKAALTLLTAPEAVARAGGIPGVNLTLRDNCFL